MALKAVWQRILTVITLQVLDVKGCLASRAASIIASQTVKVEPRAVNKAFSIYKIIVFLTFGTACRI